MRCLTLGSAATGAISLKNGKAGMQHHPRAACCCGSVTDGCCAQCELCGQGSAGLWGAASPWALPARSPCCVVTTVPIVRTGVLRAAGIPALCCAWAPNSWRMSRLGSVCSHSECCHSEHHACSWLLRTGSALPTCVCMHACAPSASMCITYPCASVCIYVQCVSLCLCARLLQPCVPHACGPGLAWGSTLGPALSSRSSRRLIPSRCGCRRPSLHRLLTEAHGGLVPLLLACTKQHLPGSCIAAGLFMACSSQLRAARQQLFWLSSLQRSHAL